MTKYTTTFCRRCGLARRSPAPRDEGGLDVPRVEPLLASILHLYEQLKKLGFTYYQGKIVVIDSEMDN